MTKRILSLLLALSLTVNAANFISTNRDLNQTLDMIYENQGTIQAKRTTATTKEKTEPPGVSSRIEEAHPPQPEEGLLRPHQEGRCPHVGPLWPDAEGRRYL